MKTKRRCPICGCIPTRAINANTAAAALACSRRQVTRMLADGRLRGFRVGRDWRVYHDSLDGYIQQSGSLGGVTAG